MLHGRCHCGAIQYEMAETVLHHALCHCTDCRRHSGAPMVGWAMVRADQVKISGNPTAYRSSEHAERLFCGKCGTSLFYINEKMLPGMIDIQSATLDDPDLLPAQAQIQTADRIKWMESAHELPSFERFPG